MINYFRKFNKFFISIIFGLIGFYVNFFSLVIFKFPELDFNVNVLLGLLFPLLITLAWGWRYGLISAFFGGCQTMWWLWYTDGYGLLYAVPIYFLWIVWHGIFADYKKMHKELKWYNSKYFIEIPFRIISALGFYTLFRWLVSLNPPFWAPEIINNFVPYKWVHLVVIKHILTSFLLLLVADILLNIKIFRKIFRINKNNNVSIKVSIIAIFIAVGLIFWILDAAAAYYIFCKNELSFLQVLLFEVPPHNLFLRTMVLILSFASGFIIARYMAKMEDKDGELKSNYNKLKLYNDKVMELNNKLISSESEVKKVANDLKKMIRLTSNLGESNIRDEKKFIIDLLYTAVEMVPEADYGLAFLYENKKPIIVGAVGHDSSILKEMKVNEILSDKEIEDIVIISYTKDYILKNIEGNLKKKIKKALKSVKQSMIIVLKLEDERIAGISIEININSVHNFSNASISTMKYFKNLSAAFFTIARYHNIQQKLFIEIVKSTINMLGIYDEYTKGHSQNVAEYAVKVAKRMLLDEDVIDKIYWTGMVHDIGKINIPKNILNKKEKLTDEEYEEIKKHPCWGCDILKNSKELIDISKYVLYHHERWDGKGYPQGLKGEEIPLISRIIAIADAWDAMLTDRAYRKGLPKTEAVQEIKKNRGTQFSPEIIDVFLEIVEDEEM